MLDQEKKVQREQREAREKKEPKFRKPSTFLLGKPTQDSKLVKMKKARK